MNGTTRIKIWVGAVAVAAGVAIIFSTCNYPHADFAKVSLLSAILLVLVAGSELFGKIELPLSSISVYVSISSPLLFGAATTLGPAAAVPVALGKLVADVVNRREPLKAVFNLSNYVLTTFATGAAYSWLAEESASPIGSRQNLMATLSAVIVFNAVNSGLAAGVLAEVARTTPWRLWRGMLRGIAFTTLTLPTLGILVPILYREHPLAVLLMAVPMFGPYLSLRSHARIHAETRHTIERLADVLDQRDPSTAAHSQRVTDFVTLIVRELPELSLAEREVILAAAPVHDIGKIGTRDMVLLKAGRLTDEEREHINRHAPDGADILANLSLYREAAEIVRHHHERWDGRGYPTGAAGEAIPLGARVIAVADTFDAMTSDRVYRKGLSRDEALKEVERCAGTQFDPRIAEIFVRVMRARAVPAPQPGALVPADPSRERFHASSGA